MENAIVKLNPSWNLTLQHPTRSAIGTACDVVYNLAIGVAAGATSLAFGAD